MAIVPSMDAALTAAYNNGSQQLRSVLIRAQNIRWIAFRFRDPHFGRGAFQKVTSLTSNDWLQLATEMQTLSVRVAALALPAVAPDIGQMLIDQLLIEYFAHPDVAENVERLARFNTALGISGQGNPIA